MKTNRNRRKKGTSELLKSLGPRKVFREGARKFMASFDGSKLSFEYDALIRARSEKDVQTTLRLANRYRIPVTTRGAGTSLTGSASPVNGGWVLDTSRMKRILIRKEKSMAIAQPGAVIGVLQKKAEEEGLFYPPDPSSLKYCTVGGNIACNAGGMRCAKYGVTRDFVVALEGFLPNGEKGTWGGEYKKFATGYNVRDLWIGSEGTLG
ncbi:MAG: FAD-binding oxidoreductase, partial [Opitutales bacterium]|nr:FAD-binding oxidoreductase [Opitutales bacterium]